MYLMLKIAFIAALGLIATPALADDGKIIFNRDIRPILSDNCYHCHGNDKNHIKGRLLLNDRDAAIKKEAIVPGKPDESEAITRIFSDDPDDIMPPPEAHKTLTPKQKELLKRWVAEGAEYQPHWAYVQPVRWETPAVQDAKWVRNPIDAFVLASLEGKKLKPSADADKRTLLRRLSLDLTGLPPTPAEVDAFLKDERPDAYERQVERLLASPHFGERMAAPWLDAVRFADTVGYHGDQNANVFPFRDYVINAFNSNKPFDQFTIEQIAGDLLPGATTEQLVASGFNRLNMMTREGGAQDKEYLAKYQADRVRTVGLTWLGSTFGCAECHDHKFDPISAKDFYAMSAFFADIRQWGIYTTYNYTPNPDLPGWSNDHPFPPEIKVDSPYLQKRMTRLESELNRVAAKVQPRDDWQQPASALLAASPDGWVTPPAAVQAAPPAPAAKPARKPAKPVATPTDKKPLDAAKEATQEKTAGSQTHKDAEDVAPKADAKPAKATQSAGDGFMTLAGANNTVTLQPNAGWIAALRFEVAGDKAKGKLEQARSLKLSAIVNPKSGKPRKVNVYFADADFKAPRYSSTYEILGVHGGWTLDAGRLNQRQTSVWLLDPPVKLAEGETLAVTVSAGVSMPVRLSVSPLADWNPLRATAPQTLAALKTPADQRSPQQKDLAGRVHLISTAADAEAWKAYRTIQQELLDCRDGKAWMQVTVSQKPITTRVLPRGNWQDESGEVVDPATPHFLPKLDGVNDRRLNRLDLAKWIISDKNPLTGRTVTNRIWKQFFGTGLCASIEDLGLQGEWPSHPELLDWLAVEFRDPKLNGAKPWDVKHIVRLIVTSSTYRQKSELPAALRDVDPANRLLAAQSPIRLEAEFVRDNALFAAGLLNLADIGGPSVKPYQPDGYYAAIQFPNRVYEPNSDERQYRRGVYMHWQRTFLHPMLANFDAPSREDSICTRVVSNTPQQGLTLLNDPQFVEASRAMAQTLLATGGSDGEKIDRLYQRTLARLPKEQEKTSLLKLLATQRSIYKSSPDEAAKLLTVGNAPATGEASELAAWTNTCRVVLNLHETITRY